VSSSEEKTNNPLRVVFIHLDLGIGGAEQLVLQLATASQDLGYLVDVVTTRCDQDHCFASVKLPDGRLSRNVAIYGRWIPPNIMGVATAFMSTIRMLYLTWQVTRKHKTADVVVVDVLPTSLPLLLSWLSSAGILFFCHFPDKLLLRNEGGLAKRLYRQLLDRLEESTMGMADTLIVNSKFTLGQVQESFPSLAQRPMGVLYPALDTTNMVQANQKPKTKASPIVSLNRFERKKNIELLIHAYAYLLKTKKMKQSDLPPLIIAGGYDTKSVENVEYRGELQQLVNGLDGVTVDFRLDISDAERATLFQTALCVVYTPDKEHFGIVPLEAMYAGTPVLAVNSGGPRETVVNGTTGFLRDPTPESFGEALLEFIRDSKKATIMGRAGRTHVEQTFGTKRFETEWTGLVKETKQLATTRSKGSRPRYALWMNTTVYFIEAFLALLLCLVITWILRLMEILGPAQSIFGAVRAGILGDEL
jgi:alpha-1,3/alpha-1,6-mannosyltransferase